MTLKSVEATTSRPPLRPFRGDPDAEKKARDLRRMRSMATLLLVAMAALFLVASLREASYPALGYVKAFAEAAMVGACADWFAVVALFRRPFGLPIPHTGIVPRNKDRIGAALGRFMSNNFLSPVVLARRLEGLDAGGYAAEWLTSPGHAEAVAAQVGQFLPQALEALPHERLVDGLANSALRGLEALPAAPLAARVLALLWARGETQALLDRAVEYAETRFAGNQDFIRRKVAEKSSRFIPKWVDGWLADRVISAVKETLADMRRPNHPWRLEVKQQVEAWLADLDGDPAVGERCEAIKRDLLSSAVFVARLREVCDDLTRRLAGSLATNPKTIAAGVEFALIALGGWLKEDTLARVRFNRWCRRIALRALSPRRAEIGAYIAEVVDHWDTTTLVNRLELQVGKDLQYIRINGALVGGLVGELIYIASKWLPTS